MNKKMNISDFPVQVLIDKAADDLRNLRIEAKSKNLESQLPRWIASYMQGLQKTNRRAHEIVVEMIENGDV